jgi:hypothetical protein
MVGAMFGDELTSQIGQETSLYGGYRVGWDFDHYWGLEGRFAFARPEVEDDGSLGVSDTSRFWSLDANLVYYPWGDSRWRPYLSLGLGCGSFDLQDAGLGFEQTLFAIPFGGGIKCYWKNWLALRLSVTDNWLIGHDSLSTMHNLTLTADVEVRFGGSRVSYFPY